MTKFSFLYLVGLLLLSKPVGATLCNILSNVVLQNNPFTYVIEKYHQSAGHGPFVIWEDTNDPVLYPKLGTLPGGALSLEKALEDLSAGSSAHPHLDEFQATILPIYDRSLRKEVYDAVVANEQTIPVHDQIYVSIHRRGQKNSIVAQARLHMIEASENVPSPKPYEDLLYRLHPDRKQDIAALVSEVNSRFSDKDQTELGRLAAKDDLSVNERNQVMETLDLSLLKTLQRLKRKSGKDIVVLVLASSKAHKKLYQLSFGFEPIGPIFGKSDQLLFATLSGLEARVLERLNSKQ